MPKRDWFLAIVLVTKYSANVRKAVAELLAPYSDRGAVKGKDSFKPKWAEWWIGGRFKGALIEHYDPTEYEENFGECAFCGGGGDWAESPLVWSNSFYAENTFIPRDGCGEPMESSLCRYCQGNGKTLKERQFWLPVDVDIQPVGKYLPLLSSGKIDRLEQPLVIVTPDGLWHEGRSGGYAIVENWREHIVLDLLEKHRDCVAVACDIEDWFGY